MERTRCRWSGTATHRLLFSSKLAHTHTLTLSFLRNNRKGRKKKTKEERKAVENNQKPV
jgi:hypothetical protein